jgi:hypothetical protein
VQYAFFNTKLAARESNTPPDLHSPLMSRHVARHEGVMGGGR